MKFFYSLRQDLNKTIINGGFIGAAFLTTILCFTANAYLDVSNSRSYSVLEAFFSFDRKFIESEQSFASISLFGRGLSGYITMFIPIIVAFPISEVHLRSERDCDTLNVRVSVSGSHFLNTLAVCLCRLPFNFLP